MRHPACDRRFARPRPAAGPARPAGLHAPAPRGGITLLEVLISIGVMAVGLLSLALLIPLGQFRVAAAVRNDRTSVLGRAAFRELQVRQLADAGQPRSLLDPRLWRDHMDDVTPETAWDVDRNSENSTGIFAPPAGVNPVPPEQFIPSFSGGTSGSPIDWGNSVCIDPLFISRAAFLEGAALPHDWPARKFPYELDNDPDPNGFGAYPNPPRMQRLNLELVVQGSTGSLENYLALRYAAAERMFIWPDDLAYTLPGDGTLRPEALLLYVDTKKTTTLRHQAAGDYSWMYILTPGAAESRVAAEQIRTLTVTVVVFHQRPLAPPAGTSTFAIADRDGLPPAERMVYCDFVSPVSWGGGSVRLRLPVTPNALNDNASQPNRSDFPRVVPGQWIMLCNWVDDFALRQRINESGASVCPLTDVTRAVFRWYKVLAADEQLTYDDSVDPLRPVWYQDATIAGPDWGAADWTTVSMPDADATGPNLNTAWAALVTGVVGVYEKTIHWRPE